MNALANGLLVLASIAAALTLSELADRALLPRYHQPADPPPRRYSRCPRRYEELFSLDMSCPKSATTYGQAALARLIFALLVAAVFGHVWLASTPLPLGGPNILPAALATLLAVVLCLWRSAPLLRPTIDGVRRAFAAAMPMASPAAMPVLLTAFAMWAWVLAVYWRTGTFDSTRLGQLTVGIGVLCASLCVLSLRRARGLIAAIVIAVSLSAVFGICVLVVGGPFVDAWLRIAEVAESDLQVVFVYGRTAGAAVHPATFGYQLVVAIVLAFAGLILGAPAHWGRWAQAADAGLFLLLICMSAAVVVNAGRSVMLSVAVGVCLCVVGVATAPFLRGVGPSRTAPPGAAPAEGSFGRRGVVRLLVVAPSSLLVLLAIFNPWLNVGGVVEELRPVRLHDGDILNLSVGGEALLSDDPHVLGHRFEGLDEGVEYRVDLRAQYPKGFGVRAVVMTKADAGGDIVVTWRTDPARHVVAYQFRLRKVGAGTKPIWRSFAPALRSRGVRLAVEEFSPRPPAWPELLDGGEALKLAENGAERIGHEFAGFSPWKWYLVQIQEVLADGVARAPRHGEVVFSPRHTGYFVVTWPAPRAPEGVAGYRFRVRGVGADWMPWRAFAPSLSGKTPVLVPAWAGGADARGEPWVRHALRGLPPGTRQAVQLRVRSASVFGAASAAVDGVVAEDGSFALAWRQATEGTVAAVQFRRRLLTHTVSTHWLPWQELTSPLDDGYTTVALSAPGRTGDEVADAAHVVRRVDGGLQLRQFPTLDFDADRRLSQAAAAWRYALDHPLGTGVYRPTRSHAGEEVHDARLDELLWTWPHNQFLHVLVLYGFPGLGLLLLFYGLLTRAAWRAGRLAWREPRPELRLLVVGVIAAWAAYSVNSLFLPTGPFLEEWDHYFVLGLLLSLEGILGEERRRPLQTSCAP